MEPIFGGQDDSSIFITHFQGKADEKKNESFASNALDYPRILGLQSVFRALLHHL